MLITLDSRSGVPIYRQVMEQVSRQILTGHAPAGAQLPSVRDLAARLKVNPMTISKAYSLLELDGLLDRRRGIGLFVSRLGRERRRRAQLEALTKVMRDTALRARQFGLSDAEATDLLRRSFCELRNEGEVSENEQ